MKIGFSMSRCFRDILDGVVPADDVVMIIARTRAPTRDAMLTLISQYHSYGELGDHDKEKCEELIMGFYDAGKIHQPRNFGSYRIATPDKFVWMDLVPTVKEMPEGAREAWEQYRMMLALASEKPIPDDEGAQWL